MTRQRAPIARRPQPGVALDLWRLWVLRGPNAWAACPVLEAGLDLGPEDEDTRDRVSGVAEQLRAWLPALAPLPDDAGLADVVERVTLHLQTLAGNPVQFGATRALPPPGRYRVAVEYREEVVGRACLAAALALCRAACDGGGFPVEEELRRLRDLADDQRRGPSTLAVAEAARARGIPVDHFNPDDGRYLLLGHGARQRRTLAAETDDISAVARSVTTDKQLTKDLLRNAGVPVPTGRPVTDAEDAWAAACSLGLPVAVKPQDRDLAQGVGLDLRTHEQVTAAYEAARQKSPCVLVERFAPGVEHRILVVDDRVAAAARVDPPHVVGDGTSPVADLVAAANRNPRRGPDSRTPLRWLKLDAVALEVLAAQGHTRESVPAAGQRVLLRRNPPYIKQGGSLSDVTDRIHPEVAACAVEAARVLRLRVAGLDVVAEDVGRPLEEQGGVVVEVNTGPGLWLHLGPWTETPRPVGEAIVATLFPPGSDGRIPVVAVAGDRAQATAGRHLAALLARRGVCVGRAGGQGIAVGNREVRLPGTTALGRARAVLRNPVVEAAVLEATAGELLEEGLGCDRCDVAVVLDLRALAEDLVEACGAVLRALAPGGKAVLDADHAPAIAPLLVPPERTVWFARDGRHRRVTDHRAAGGTAVFLDEGAVVLAQGADEKRLSAGERLREPDRHERLGLLAALAAGVALGLGAEELQSYLASPGSTHPTPADTLRDPVYEGK